MPNFTGIITKEFTPKVQSLIDDIRRARDRDYFKPTGTQMYTGQQGSGKTLTAVSHMLKLKMRWPKAIVVSNLKLEYMKPVTIEQYLAQGLVNPDKYYVFFEDIDSLGKCLTAVNNGKFGVIYLIDEIHTYFNALDSKNIPMYIFTEISQQRKQRKIILATSQLFLRTAKPFREQCDNVILCKGIFGFITVTRAFDGAKMSQEGVEEKSIHAKKIGWYFHTRFKRDAYDTYQKVVSGAEQYAQTSSLSISKKHIKLT